MNLRSMLGMALGIGSGAPVRPIPPTTPPKASNIPEAARHKCVARRAKIIANRPGLATLKCLDCGLVRTAEYTTRREYDEMVEAFKQARKMPVRRR